MSIHVCFVRGVQEPGLSFSSVRTRTSLMVLLGDADVDAVLMEQN